MSERIDSDYGVVNLGKLTALVVNKACCSAMREVAPGKSLFTQEWYPVIETHPQIADSLAHILGKRGQGIQCTEPELALLKAFYAFREANPGKAWRPDWYATVRPVMLQGIPKEAR